MDETACALDPPLVRCWMKKGTQTTVPLAAGSNSLLHLSGAFNMVTGAVITTVAAARNTTAFIAFLEHLMLNTDPNKDICLVMDNASFHTSKAAEAAIALYEPRLQVFWLPTYAPQLNPIERFWRYLKTTAYGNHPLASLASVREHLQVVLNRQNQLDNPDRYRLSS